jgi:hypothetical protein
MYNEQLKWALRGATVLLYLGVIGFIWYMYRWRWLTVEAERQKEDKEKERKLSATPGSQAQAAISVAPVPISEMLTWWNCYHARVTGAAITYLFAVPLIYMFGWNWILSTGLNVRPIGLPLFWAGVMLTALLAGFKPKHSLVFPGALALTMLLSTIMVYTASALLASPTVQRILTPKPKIVVARPVPALLPITVRVNRCEPVEMIVPCNQRIDHSEVEPAGETVDVVTEHGQKFRDGGPYDPPIPRVDNIIQEKWYVKAVDKAEVYTIYVSKK